MGTLIPFVVAYISVLGLHPFGVLFAFGAAMVVCGIVYKTPIPVQPMKAIGAVASIQAVQTATVTPGAVYVAAAFTGLVWLGLGASGLLSRLTRLIPAVVVTGVLLGLGLGFMLQAVKMMQSNWLLAIAGAVVVLGLMRSRTIPAMFVLLLFGAAVGAYQNPELLSKLGDASISLRLPEFSLGSVTWHEVFVGIVLLALPQVPLTLGNAVIAITSENNRLFPERPVTERRMAISTGVINLFSGAIGGVPMCHGAGGMAGHMAFGARTGGSVVLLGGLLLVLALFFSDSVVHLFRLVPASILGVILFVTGLHLCLGSSVLPVDTGQRGVVLVCAVLCIWNVAVGFAVGVLLAWLLEWRMRPR